MSLFNYMVLLVNLMKWRWPTVDETRSIVPPSINSNWRATTLASQPNCALDTTTKAGVPVGCWTVWWSRRNVTKAKHSTFRAVVGCPTAKTTNSNVFFFVIVPILITYSTFCFSSLDKELFVNCLLRLMVCQCWNQKSIRLKCALAIVAAPALTPMCLFKSMAKTTLILVCVNYLAKVCFSTLIILIFFKIYFLLFFSLLK